MRGGKASDRQPAVNCLRDLLASWWVVVVVILSIAAACSPATPVPPPPEVDAPKLIATVILSPTPPGTVVLPTLEPSPAPSRTLTPIPPTPTPSRTPYVGVFMGDGSAPLVLPTGQSDASVIQATLQRATPLPGAPGVSTLPPGVFPTATFPFGVAPTFSVVQSDTGCSIEPDPAFLNAYLSDPAIRAAIGCPVDVAQQTVMAYQVFERGVMLWRETGDDIYALVTGTVGGVNRPFWRTDDLWQDGMPETDSSLIAPPGLTQPRRGFGESWRVYAPIQEALGWAVETETGYSGLWQEFERGLILNGPSTGQVYVLVPADNPVTRGQYFGPLF